MKTWVWSSEPGIVECTCNPRSSKEETGNLWGSLVNQLSLLSWLQGNERHCLKGSWYSWEIKPEVVLWPQSAHTQRISKSGSEVHDSQRKLVGEKIIIRSLFLHLSIGNLDIVWGSNTVLNDFIWAYRQPLKLLPAVSASFYSWLIW